MRDAPVSIIIAATEFVPEVILVKGMVPAIVPVIVPLQDKFPVALYTVQPVDPYPPAISISPVESRRTIPAA